MGEPAGGLLVLCHHGGFDRLYSAFSAAAAAGSMGRPANVVLFFEALERLMNEDLDQVILVPSDQAAQERMDERVGARNASTPADLWAALRGMEPVRTYACSASVALEGFTPAQVQSAVDEVIGWPTILTLMDDAEHVLTF